MGQGEKDVSMVAKRMSVLGLIDETIEYYRTHPRAGNAANCFYKSKDGCMCSVGRLLKDPELIEDIYGGRGVASIKNLKEHLKPEYSHFVNSDDDFNTFLHSPHIFEELQDLHDSESNWVENAHGGVDLNQFGQDTVDELRERYSQTEEM